MNKQNFDDKHRHLQFHKDEMERKWKAYLREQEELEFLRMQAIYEALQQQSTSTSTGAGGGGGNGFTGDVQASFIRFIDPSTNEWNIIVANNETLTIYDPIKTGLNGYDYGFQYAIIDGKGFLFVFFNYATYIPTFFFVDVNGKIIEKVDQVTDSNWDYNGVSGLSVMVYYTDPEDSEATIVKWWMGGDIFTKKISATGLNYWIQSGDSAMSDGTFTTYYTDNDGKDIVFLHNAKGECINIKNVLYRIPEGIDYNGIYGYSNSNFILVEFYNGTIYDKFRLVFSNGTYKELDLTAYSANNAQVSMYGTSRVVIVCKPDDTNLDRTVVVYDAISNKTYTTTYSYQDNDMFGYVFIVYSSASKFVDYFYTEDGNNNLILVLSQYDGWDGRMSIFPKFKLIWLFGGQQNFHSWTPASLAINGSVNVCLSGVAETTTWLYHNIGDTFLKQVFLTKEGAVDEVDFPFGVHYSELGSTIDYVAFGNRQLTRIQDNNAQISYVVIHEGTDLITTYTVNGLEMYFNSNLNLLTALYRVGSYYISYIRSNDSSFTEITDRTYEYYSFPNENDTCDYVDNYKFSSAFIGVAGGIDYFVTGDSNSTPAEIDQTAYANLLDTRVYKDYAIISYRDPENNNIYTIDFIDTNANILSTVSFPNVDNYDIFLSVNKRITIVYNDSEGQYYFGIASPQGTAFAPISDSYWDPGFNDYRYYDYNA